jgi:excisionase family DNA binding protein
MENLLTMFREFLAGIVREEIEQALRQQRPESLLLNTNEAATLLSVKPSKVAAMARNGKLPKVENLGHAVRFRRADIENLCTQSSGSVSPAKSTRTSRRSCEAGAVDGAAGRGASGAASITTIQKT